jgi:hypothetical protein
MTNGQLSAPAPAPIVAAPQPDPNQGSFSLDDNSMVCLHPPILYNSGLTTI